MTCKVEVWRFPRGHLGLDRRADAIHGEMEYVLVIEQGGYQLGHRTPRQNG